ncbi:MAG: helix-hairpin-helix domain-containing protein [Acidimicrobiales bacterium]
MLAGITSELAGRIVAYRSDGGMFVSVEDMALVLDLPPTMIAPL